MYAYLAEYTEYLEMNISRKNTIDAYVRDVSAFLQYANAESAAVLRSFSHDDAQGYVESMTAQGKAASSISRNLASLRAFYRFLNLRGYVEGNPFVKLETAKAEKKMPSILTNKEVDKLLNQPDLETPKGVRDRAMLELLYATGMRVSEIIDLNITDISLDLGFVRCKMYDDERIIPIYPMAVKAIAAYVENVRAVYSSEDTVALFINFSGERLTRQGFWKVIKQYQKSACIKTSITPQTLRHSFAAHLIENGADLHDVQEMLGHSDIASTQVYARFVKNKFKNVYSKFHPRA